MPPSPVGCSAVPTPVRGLDLADCGSVPAGGTCSVGCGPGWASAVLQNRSGSATAVDAVWSCPADNTDAARDVEGAIPPCRRIVACGELQYDEFMQVVARCCNAKIPVENRGGEGFEYTLQAWLHYMVVPTYKQLIKDKARGIASKTL